MYAFIVLLLMRNAVSVSNITKEKCDGLVFNNVYYDRQMLFNGFGKTYNLMTHPTGNLFFSHLVHNRNKTYRITVCNMHSMTCHRVKGVLDGYAIGYDRGNDKIYFGGKGIYRYNFQKQDASYFGQKYKTISDLSIGRNFYYIEYPTKKLYIYKRGHFVKSNKTEHMEIEKIFVSRNIKMYFVNKTGLFKVEKPYKRPRVHILSDELVIKQISQDVRSKVYFCATDGIYVEDGINHRLKKIADIDQANGLTFDEKQRILYSNSDAIFRLLPSIHTTLCSYKNSNGDVIKKETISIVKTSTDTVIYQDKTHQATSSLNIQRRFVKPEFYFRGQRMHF